MPRIHVTAVIDKTAILADDVEVGPYCFIGPEVTIGAGTILGTQCIVHRWTSIGKGNHFTAACSIGADPQDLKYKGEKTYLVIGDNNTVREYVTLNRGTGQGSKTIIGSNNLFMTTSHVGHNSVVGNNVVIANSVAMGGHAIIEDRVVIGGVTGIHQFCRVGKLSITGGCSKIVQDVPPYSMCDGNPARIYGLNKIGLERVGITKEVQTALKKAFKILFGEKLLVPNAIKKAEAAFGTGIPEIVHLIQFVKSSERGISHWIK